jgi:glutathione S-transferase
MKIFGNPVSTCTRKVLMTAYETQTPFELVVVDFTKGEHKQAPHVARQPFGQVPALEDDGFELFESRAMARYIDAKSGGSLTPKDLQGRALMEQWISIETSNFTPHAMKFIYHSVFKREQTPEVLKAAGGALDTAYGVMERTLTQSPFLVGDKLTLADICFAPYVEYLALSPAAAKLTEHPRVAAWWAKVSERPTWRKVAGRA